MIGYIILGIIVVLLAVILIRTAAFKPAPEKEQRFEEISFDKDGAVDALAQLKSQMG